MNRPTVVLTRRIGVTSADEAIDAAAEVVVAASPASADVAAALEGADGLIAIRPTLIDRDLIAAASSLKVISALGSGCDHVDVDAASEHGIPVTSGAGVAAGAVAEFTLGAAVAGHRRFLGMHEDLLAGRPWGEIKRTIGWGLDGTTFGVVGYGKIGRLVAEGAARTFGAKVLVFDPYLNRATATLPEGAEIAESLADLMARSVTVSVHVPLTDETRGLIGADELAALGPGSVLVQASRGGVVDENELVVALASGSLGSAVVDVFETEPPAPELLHELAATGRVLLTPHMASFTHQAINDLAHAAVRDVVAVLAGESPPSIVNSDAIARKGLAR